MRAVIKVESLSKRYLIHHEKSARSTTLREAIGGTALNWGKKIISPFTGARRSFLNEEYWALKDVSFDVKQGDRLGIIGKNGAGKSTLLKILSRITDPTSGRVSIKGRVSSLLEVGTGFHPELTGRENIFLNGAILGMSKAEIGRKFDEIVAFSEIEKFLDTPVKRYSSGMYVRLAFAVAAHLEPEILIVDEVLAVGDAQFQKKCLGKMEQVGKEGRTVLFVSHNTSAVTHLCSKAVLLNAGSVVTTGDAESVVDHYISSLTIGALPPQPDVVIQDSKRETIRFGEVRTLNTAGKPSRHFAIGEDLNVSFDVVCNTELEAPQISVKIRRDDGILVCDAYGVDSNFKFLRPAGKENISVIFRDIRFYPGSYFVTLRLMSQDGRELYDRAKDCVVFHVVSGGNVVKRFLKSERCLLYLKPQWARNASTPAEPLVRNQNDH
jgi:lipopolysaccharide transport system ATP-binding protein